MNTRTSFSSALLALLGLSLATPLFAGSGNYTGSMHPVERVNVRGQRVLVGATDAQLLRVLGEPHHTRIGNPTGRQVERVWVYRDMEGRGGGKTTAEDGCDTFLVTLVADGRGRLRVADMKLVDERADRYYAAQIYGTGSIYAGR